MYVVYILINWTAGYLNSFANLECFLTLQVIQSVTLQNWCDAYAYVFKVTILVKQFCRVRPTREGSDSHAH